MIFPISHGIFAAQTRGSSADKTALLAALAAASELDPEAYTTESWALLASAEAAGQLVYDDPNATQQQVDDAAQAITDAIAGLVPVPTVCSVTLTHDAVPLLPGLSPADIDGQRFGVTDAEAGTYVVSSPLSALRPMPTSGRMWVQMGSPIVEPPDPHTGQHIRLGLVGLTDGIPISVAYLRFTGSEWAVSVETPPGNEIGAEPSVPARGPLAVDDSGEVWVLTTSGARSLASMQPILGAALAGATHVALLGLVDASSGGPLTASATIDTDAAQFVGSVGAGEDWCSNELPVAGNRAVFPLTYDESDHDGGIELIRSGGPMITPLGFRGNGYDARLHASIPEWMAFSSSPLTIHASVRAVQVLRDPNRSRIVTVANPSQPKLQLVVVADPHDQDHFQIAANWHDGELQSLNLGRRDWVYELRYPELEADGYNALPQGLKFVDADTLLIAAHYDYEFSLCHRIRLSDKAVTGRFLFETEDGTLVAPKNGAISQRPSDGSYWFSDNTNKVLYELDLEASFASGFMVVTNTFDCTAVSSTAAICWIDSGGSEYLLIGEYASSATAYLYVIPGSVVASNSVFALGDRYKRFTMPKKTQGLVMRDGMLFVSSNNPEAGSTFNGRMYTVDIHSAIAGAADGSALTPMQHFYAPGGCPEDVDVHPVTGDIWMPTEGDTAIGVGNGYRGIWSSPVNGVIPDGSPQENHYTLTYNGTDALEVRVNNQPFESITTTIVQDPETISIAGHAVAVPGQASGYFIGYVRNVVVADRPLTQQEYHDATTGAYEPRTLANYPVPIVNPGAEDGVTGWTMEVGGMDTRSADPPPHSGLAYFNGGAHAQTIGSQRHSLTDITGLSGEQIDAMESWVVVEWWQAAWDNSSGTATDEDLAAIGVRFADADGNTVSTDYPALIRVDPRLWWLNRSGSAMVPFGARYVDILYRSDRYSGTNNDGRIDDISASVFARQLPGPTPVEQWVGMRIEMSATWPGNIQTPESDPEYPGVLYELTSADWTFVLGINAGVGMQSSPPPPAVVGDDGSMLISIMNWVGMDGGGEDLGPVTGSVSVDRYIAHNTETGETRLYDESGAITSTVMLGAFDLTQPPAAAGLTLSFMHGLDGWYPEYFRITGDVSADFLPEGIEPAHADYLVSVPD